MGSGTAWPDNVIAFPRSNLSDVPAMLRKLADDIDAGQHGDVPVCLVVIPRGGGWPDMFGFGPDGDTSDAALIGHFEMAKAWFIHQMANE